MDLLLDGHRCGRVDKNISPVGAAGSGGVAVDTLPESAPVIVYAAVQFLKRPNRGGKLVVPLPRLGFVVKTTMGGRAATLPLHAHVVEGGGRIGGAREHLHSLLGNLLTL